MFKVAMFTANKYTFCPDHPCHANWWGSIRT